MNQIAIKLPVNLDRNRILVGEKLLALLDIKLMVILSVPVFVQTGHGRKWRKSQQDQDTCVS